jgi:hypothetical protein
MPLGISELVSLLFDLGKHGERDHEKAPCMELSAGNIQQRQYDRNFEYEYQNRENAIIITNDNTGASEIQREEQVIKLTLAQIVTARDYFQVAVGSVQDSDLEVFDYMLRCQEEICEVVPETYQMLQSDNAFDDVELQDPLIVIRGNDIILRVHGGEVIDGNNMWILQVSDDSSPQNYLRHQLCTERHEAAVMGCIPRSSVCNSTIPSADIQIELECQDVDDWANETNSQRGVQKNDIADGVDLTLTAILEMFPETVESIGEDQSATI